MPFKWSLLKKYLKNASVELFFIDGGDIHRPKFQKNYPEILVDALNIGDGDSSKISMDLKKTDQNLSDLAFFLQKIAIKKPASQYIFLGFLGGRHDHHLFNLGEIFKFSKNRSSKKPTRILMEDKIEFFSAGLNQFKTSGVFSITSFEDSLIKISGDCLYKTHGWLKLPAMSSRGLSNEGHGLITLESKTTVILVFFEGKKLD